MKKCFTKPCGVMKICAAQAMMALVVCGVTAAHDNYAQLLDTKITLSLKEVAFEVALKKIESASRVKIFYSIDQLDINEPVSIEAKDETVRDVLDDLLSPYNIKYKVNERKRAVILKRQTDIGANEEANLKESPFILTGQYQPATITGIVLDAISGQPMAGVNIIVKGTTVGTTTDSEGKYIIEAENNDVLVFSFIGYATYETLVNGQSVIDVSLKEDATSLGEVVINAGYWQVFDRERTGNITKVEAKDIQKQPVSNPLAALQARVPGLEITQQTGVPGGNFVVRIRGTNSIANGNDPLYIVDGVPFTSASLSMPETSGTISGPGGFSPLNSINPFDIESIEVLKDADATAIYGSRGSNGVILITTKKGVEGKTRLDFNLYAGTGEVINKLDLLNTSQYLLMRNQAFANDNVTPTIANARDLLVWDTTRYTDWQKELIGGTAQTYDAQLSLSGGEKNTHFFIGGAYHKETTVFPGDNADQRVSAHSSIVNSSLNEKLKTTFLFNYSSNNSDLLRQDLTQRALLLPPIAPSLYYENGDISWENWSSIFENPVAHTKRIYDGKTNNLIVNAIISYALLPNLEVKSSLGFTSMSMKAISTTPISSQFPDPAAKNITAFSNSGFQNWVVEPLLSWKPKLGTGQLNILVGSTFLDQTVEGLSQTGEGFSSEALMKNLSSAPIRTLGTNYYSQYRYHAIFGRINYSWRGKYIANLTGRRDGSSRFGPGKQFASFGAVGIAWIFSEERFLKNGFPFVSFGKLRASYGTTGNDQLGDYQFLDTYSSSSGPYQGSIGLQPDRLSNPEFAWETNRKFEVGLEFGFLANAIVGSVSYYTNRSSNQLVGFPLPTTAGFSTIQGNFPATVQNTGLEIQLGTTNIGTTNFTWTSSINVSIPTNKLVEFPNIESFPAYSNTYVVGEPLAIRKLNNYTGIDAVTGVYTFEDVNGDGTYDFLDRQTVKFLGQDCFGGLQNAFQYKGFQLDMLFQFVSQTGNNYILSFDAPGVLANTPTIVMDRWQSEGDYNSVQRFSQTGTPLTAYSRLQASQYSVSDASFIRLKNLSFSYSLPHAWIAKLHIENANVFVQGQNVLTFTKYTGLDPETRSGSQLPPLRVFTSGIRLTL